MKVKCGVCEKEMTPENSKMHPEFFVCDTCAPAAVCVDMGCHLNIDAPSARTAQGIEALKEKYK